MFVISALLGAFLLYMTYSVESAILAVAYQTCSGFILMFGVAAFWAIPVNVLPKEVMGASAATVNFGGQIAGFISPIVMGYLVQITGGSFNAAFIFIIAAAVVAALVSLVIKEQGLHTPVVELAKGSSPGSSAALGN